MARNKNINSQSVSAVGRRRPKKSNKTRPWQRRPSNAPPSTKWKTPVNPGAKGSRYTGTTPAVSTASAAWYKSVLDPAHARSYGCKGIPDENRNPTLVFCGRKDMTLDSSSVEAGTPAWLLGMDWIITDEIAKNFYHNAYDNKGGGAASVKTAPKVVASTNTSATRQVYFKFDSGSKIEYVELFISAHIGLVIRLVGKFNYTFQAGLYAVSGSNWVISAERPVKNANDILIGVSTVIDQNQGFTCRPVSASVTVDNVTQWSTLGGYYTAGHIPFRAAQLSEPTEQAKMDDLSYTIQGGEVLDDFSTYNGQTSAGAYTISRPRNVHAMCWFGPVQTNELCASQEPASQSTFYMKVPWMGSPDTAWDMGFVRWFPTTDKWTIRITSYENLEVIKSYQEGGSDAARYDKVAMEHLMAMLDYCDFVFEAKANDMKKVAGYVKRTVKKYKDPILAAMGIAGSPGWLNKLTGKLIDRLGNV